jgi:hypothetical protein
VPVRVPPVCVIIQTHCIVQDDLPAAIKEGRYPLYKTPIHDITDEALARIVPDPFGVEYLVPIFTAALQTVFIQQMKRMFLPMPSNSAKLATISISGSTRQKKKSKQSDGAQEDSDERYFFSGSNNAAENGTGAICGLEFLINAKTRNTVAPDQGM